MLTMKIKASLIKVGDVVKLSGRSPQKVVGWAMFLDKVYGEQYALTLEHGARMECGENFKLDVVAFDASDIKTEA